LMYLIPVLQHHGPTEFPIMYIYLLWLHLVCKVFWHQYKILNLHGDVIHGNLFSCYKSFIQQ